MSIKTILPESRVLDMPLDEQIEYFKSLSFHELEALCTFFSISLTKYREALKSKPETFETSLSL